MLQISILGPLEVRRDGELVAVPGGKVTELLVRLAVEAGTYVRADRLVDELWTAGSATTRRNTLQSKVTRLRRALGDTQLVASGDRGYALTVAPAQVDALTVSNRAATASRMSEEGDDRGAVDVCASTLRLYRGELLQAAGDGDWATPHRARLEEARIRLLEISFAARIRLGEAGAVIGEITAAVESHPFQEVLWELLITAQYTAGRQVDALASYQRIRSRLDDELGLEPGPRLQQLEQRILQQDASLGGPASRSATPEPEWTAPGGNLPSMSIELVGRAADLDALADLIVGERLVVIVGPGGIGKTVVAIALGRRLAAAAGTGSGGVWLARLETAVTPNDVIDTLIAALNLPGGDDAVFERLKNTDAVVILDNCEHVIDAAAALAVRLLDAAPRLRVVATSQVPLGVDGEAVFELAPLALPDAAALFTRRANAHRPRGTPAGGDAAVLELCRSLDGLPLAIELAAARTRTLTIEEITRRLDDRFVVLSDPTSRKPERRRSLRSTIRWSYELLFPDDQRGLWALAIFAGGAPLPAVEFVIAALEVPAAAAIDVVGRLASRSLVIVDDAPVGPEGPGRSVRYRLLDSIRAFALEAATAAGLRDRAQAAHAQWFAEKADRATLGVRSGEQAAQLAFIRAERPNIDTALAWSATHDPQLGLGIANGFGWAWVVLGDSRGAQRLSDALAAAGDAAPVRDRAGALLLTGWIEASTGRLDVAREHITAAGDLADALPDRDLQARCAYYLAYVVSHDGEFRLAMELTERSRALYEGLDRPWDQAANSLFAARAAISASDEEQSVRAVERVQQCLQRVDDPWLHARGEAIIGELARVQRRFDDAVTHLQRAAETSRRLGFLQTEAFQLFSLGRAQCQAGQYQAGLSTLELAVDRAEATGDARLAALARVHLGRVLRGLGLLTRARAAVEAAAAWHRAAGGGEQALLGECLLAALDVAEGVAGADDRLETILRDARRHDDTQVEVLALDALARAATEVGNLATARDLIAAADRRMDAAAHLITNTDRSDARAVRQLI